jgi:hypothetical protein
MYKSPRSFQQSFSAHQSDALNVVATYHFHSPSVFAARERLATHLARRPIERDDPGSDASRPGLVRRWLGERLVWLGTRLGGAGEPKSTALAPGKVAA